MKIINTLMKSELFTPSEKVVSHYILKNKEKVLSMSIQDLSQKSFTSNPTILRVCRKCGCKGYKDFKILLAKEVEQLTYEISQINGDIPFQKNDKNIDIAKQISSLFQDSIRRTYKLIDEKTLNDVTNLLFRSKIIYLYGYGDCLFPAMSFKNKLIKINKQAILGFNNNQEAFHLHNTTKNDCVIFITYRGQKNLIKYAKYLSTKNVPIICITANDQSAIAKYSHIVIKLEKNEEEKNKIASFSSIIETEYIFSVLFACLFALNYDDNFIFRALNIKELYDYDILSST